LAAVFDPLAREGAAILFCALESAVLFFEVCDEGAAVSCATENWSLFFCALESALFELGEEGFEGGVLFVCEGGVFSPGEIPASAAAAVVSVSAAAAVVFEAPFFSPWEAAVTAAAAAPSHPPIH
jgi:hypothetical protein